MDNIRVEQRTTEWSKTRRRKKAWQRVLAGMMAVVVFTTTYALILPAITKEGETFCGVAEHEHTEACYERVLICGYPAEEQGASVILGGTHEAQALEATGEATDAEPADGEDVDDPNNVILSGGGDAAEVEESPTERQDANTTGSFDYAQDDSTVEPTTEPTEAPAPVEPAPAVPDRHVHTEACYEQRLVCETEAHVHSLACFSDPGADVETEADWAASVADVELTGDWAADLVAIAQSQLKQQVGESEANYLIGEDGKPHGYTRYGAWWGAPYEPWCAMFVSFCLNYARVDEALMPRDSGTIHWTETLKLQGLWREPADYSPVPGDLIFFDFDRDTHADHVGIVTENKDGELTTIEGNNDPVVKEYKYNSSREDILGYAALPTNPNPGTVAEQAERTTTPAEDASELVVLTAVADGVTVTLSGPKSALPWAWEELELRVVPLEDEAAVALIEAETETAEGTERRTRLFDITILHKGEEVQPLGEVEVNFAGISTPNADAQAFYVDPEAGVVEEMPLDQDHTMKTPHFTIYGLSWSVGSIEDDYVPGKGVLSAVKLLRTVTGTEPFDKDTNGNPLDTPGNDSSADNDLIRSFDHIFYNIGYTANLKNPYTDTVKGYKKAKLYLRAELPIAADQAEFDLSAMGWLADAQLTGTNPQVLTGYYQMSAGGDADYALPGEGTVRLAVYVKGMANDATVPAPSVELWLDDGNDGTKPTDASLIKSVTGIQPATVRAATPKNFDVRIVHASGENVSVEGSSPLIFGTTASDSLPGANGTRPPWTLVHTYLSVSLVESAKGMRGFLADPFTLEFDVYPRYDYWRNTTQSGSSTTRFRLASLVDYSLIHDDPSLLTGELGNPLGLPASDRVGRSYLPYSKSQFGTPENSAVDSGSLSASVVESYFVRMRFENVVLGDTFPTHVAEPNASSPSVSPLTVCAGSLHFLMNHVHTDGQAATTGWSEEVRVFISDGSLRVNGVTANETNSANNEVQAYSNYLVNDTVTYWSQTLAWYDDGTRPRVNGGLTVDVGDAFWLTQEVTDPNGVTRQNFIFCFNGNQFEPLDAGVWRSTDDFFDASTHYAPNGFSQSIYYLDYWPDADDWMGTNYYTSLEALVNDGKTCRCVWVNMRRDISAQLWGSHRYGGFLKLRVKDSARPTVGAVSGNPNDIRMQIRTMNGNTYGYYSGCASHNPTRDVYQYTRSYGKEQWTYDSQGNVLNVQGGTVYARHGNANYSQAPIVATAAGRIGRAAVYIRGAALELENNVKTLSNVSLDTNQRAADFELVPGVTTKAATPTPTTVTITETLPKGLSYTPNSAYIGGTYTAPTDPTKHGSVSGGVKLNDDGTKVTGVPYNNTDNGDVSFTVATDANGVTTLTWTLENVTPGHDLPKLYFGADIGDPNDPANDVQDGKTLTATATISAPGAALASASSSIRVHKLDKGTMIKKVKYETVKKGEEIVFSLDYINDSGNEVQSMTLRDVLPFTGDTARGNSFTGSYKLDVAVDQSAAYTNAAGRSVNWVIKATNSPQARTPEALADPFIVPESDFGSFTPNAALPPTMIQIKNADNSPIPANAKLRILVTLTPSGDNANGDVYANDIAMQSSVSAGTLKTAVVSTRVVDFDLKINKLDKDSGDPIPNVEFKLNGVRANTVKNARETDPNVDPAQVTPRVEMTETTGDGTNNTTLGEAVFESLTAGEYTLTETTPTNYKPLNITWTLQVDKNGTVTVTPSDGSTAAFDAATKTLTVENELDGVTLTVSKVVDDTTSTEPFGFTLTLKDGNQPLAGLDAANVTVKDANDADVTSQAAVSVPEAGVYGFTLQHGWTASFPAVPVGTAATVKETSHDGYTVVIQAGTNSTVGDEAGFTVSTVVKDVTVTNTAGQVLPHTGGPGTFLSTAFGLSLMATTVVCGLMRRRRERRFEA